MQGHESQPFQTQLIGHNALHITGNLEFQNSVSCYLTRLAESAVIHQIWAGLAMLVSRQIKCGSHDFEFVIFLDIKTLKWKTLRPMP